MNGLSASALGFLFLGWAGVWLWLDAMRARERAVAACRRACDRAGVQLLDETVALAGIRVRRTGTGGLPLCRIYRFEFSHSGNDRHSGAVTMVGGRVMDVWLDGLADRTGAGPI